MWNSRRGSTYYRRAGSSVREHVGRQLARRASEHGPGLGAEGRQLGGLSRPEIRVVLEPPRAAVEVGTGRGAVAQAVPGHRQEEPVEAVEPALAGGQAPFEQGHSLGVG